MTHTLTLPSICRSVTYILWSSDFASYLEDCSMEKRCTWDNGSLWLKDQPCKIYVGQWPIFHGPLILPYIIVRLKLFLYIKKWHRSGVIMPLRALTLVDNVLKYAGKIINILKFYHGWTSILLTDLNTHLITYFRANHLSAVSFEDNPLLHQSILSAFVLEIIGQRKIRFINLLPQ